MSRSVNPSPFSAKLTKAFAEEAEIAVARLEARGVDPVGDRDMGVSPGSAPGQEYECVHRSSNTGRYVEIKRQVRRRVAKKTG